MPSFNRPEWDELLAAVHAWHLNPDHLAAEVLRRRSVEWLDESEIAQLDPSGGGRLAGERPANERPVAEQSAGERVRHMRLAGRVLRRVMLSHYTGVEPAAWKFAAGANGKPVIAAPAGFDSLHFNLTHTEGFLACAVSRAGAVGIDAEQTSRPVDIEQVARHFFSPAEQQRLADLPPERRADYFFEQWVLKEAYLKGMGTGLSQSPETFTIPLAAVGHPLDHENWQFAIARPTPQHAAAVAVHSQDGAAIRVEWREADGLISQRIL